MNKCCNLCGSNKLKLTINFGSHPSSKSMFKNSNPLLSELHEIILMNCLNCGLLQLKDSIKDESLYENYFTHRNWKKQPHLENELAFLIENKYININSTVLEIGSNDGNFLKKLYSLDIKNTIGVEPALDAFNMSEKLGIRAINKFFNLNVAIELKKEFKGFDLIVSRQSLEHIPDLRETAKSIKYLLNKNGVLLIEVPDMEMSLSNRDYTIWDEHTNYFTLDTLKLFLQLCGCNIIHYDRFNFSGTCIYVVGQQIDKYSISYNYLDNLLNKTDKYSLDWPLFKSNFISYISMLKSLNKKIALYGLSARAFSILNYIGLDFNQIDFFIDDNQEKNQSLFINAITSENLSYKAIDICILGVSGEHEYQITTRHKEFIIKGGKFISILPPSDFLPDFWFN
jgi:SAM-dependent methyltransferase